MTYLFTFFLKLLSYLPLWALYGISDFLYLVLYKIFGYRKKVVDENLRNSFPEKTEKEIKQIRNRFYKNLCDIIVEAIKMISMDKEELERRNPHHEHQVLDELNAKGRTCFYFAGHTGNWEWSPCVAGIASKVPLWGVYTTVENKAIDEMIKTYRSRFGCEMIPMEQIARRLLTNRETKNVCFIADQTPANPEANTWVKFLNQETLAFSASAKLAKKLNAAIIYSSFIRTSRGHYNYHFEVLIDDPRMLDEQQIMQLFFDRLEKDIRQYPDMWLWSHKRWKHSKYK